MIPSCPICSCKDAHAIWSLEASPLNHLLSESDVVTARSFAPLSISECRRCGHWYNQAFSVTEGRVAYEQSMLTNVPVHPGMVQRLESLVSWLKPEVLRDRSIAEIGAGSGHLARLLAGEASSVTVFEPNVNLSREMLPESNITLFHEYFSADRWMESFETIVCRQVLEHVTDPQGFLEEIWEALKPGGYLYLEVPRAEFVAAERAFSDFHNAHVQYFFEDILARLLQAAGFSILDKKSILRGHDLCLMLQKCSRDTVKEFPPKPDRGAIDTDFIRSLTSLNARLKESQKPLALYGASWHAVGILSAVDDECEITAAFDDNPAYRRRQLYTTSRRIPVLPSESPELHSFRSIVIAAHLHEATIRSRLAALGWHYACLSILNKDGL